jgi:ATP-binding cassette subfamily C protein CydD
VIPGSRHGHWRSALVDIGVPDGSANSVQRFRTSARDLQQRTMNALRIAFLSSTFLELFAAIGVAMVAIYVGFILPDATHFGNWGRGLSLGEGVFLLMLAPEYFQSLRDRAGAWHDKAAARAVAAQLSALAHNRHTNVLGRGGKASALGGQCLRGPSGLRWSLRSFCCAG